MARVFSAFSSAENGFASSSHLPYATLGPAATAALLADSSACANSHSAWKEAQRDAASLVDAFPVDAEAEASADRLVETCAMWVFMGAMMCAVVSLGFLVLPMVGASY
ncbi:MAG: hypothetical protein EOO54_09210 [Haliea sp.]|nr:MAG: hypothetical protein EOO54_09210 [Haliea sp.]